jgi:hypothetical protein
MTSPPIACIDGIIKISPHDLETFDIAEVNNVIVTIVSVVGSKHAIPSASAVRIDSITQKTTRDK